MTSLRTFQTEIDEIHIRETTKQRAQAAAEKEKEKENKNPHPKGKAREDESDVSKRTSVSRAEMLEVEEQIQVGVTSRSLPFIVTESLHFRHYFYRQLHQTTTKLGISSLH